MSGDLESFVRNVQKFGQMLWTTWILSANWVLLEEVETFNMCIGSISLKTSFLYMYLDLRYCLVHVISCIFRVLVHVQKYPSNSNPWTKIGFMEQVNLCEQFLLKFVTNTFRNIIVSYIFVLSIIHIKYEAGVLTKETKICMEQL